MAVYFYPVSTNKCFQHLRCHCNNKKKEILGCILISRFYLSLFKFELIITIVVIMQKLYQSVLFHFPVPVERVFPESCGNPEGAESYPDKSP